MNKKFTKLLGVTLAIMLLTSLIAVATPASASTLLMYREKSVEDLQTGVDNVVVAGSEIVDLAANGDRIYAAVTFPEAITLEVTTVLNADDTITVDYINQDGEAATSVGDLVGAALAVGATVDVTLAGGDTGVIDVTDVTDAAGAATGQVSVVGLTSDTVFATYNVDGTFTDNEVTSGIYKSSNAGDTWTNLLGTTDYPEEKAIKLVAVAPDDPAVLVITAYDNESYYSSDGGSQWSELDQPATAIVNAIDVSGLAAGYRYVAAAGILGAGAELYTMKLAMAEPWEATSIYAGDAAGQTSFAAVKFSPNYQIDRIIASVSGDGADAFFQVFRNEEGAETWNGQISFFNLADWGTGVWLDDPADDYSEDVGALASADISLPSAYMATDEGERIAFVAIAGAVAGDGGVIRVTDSNPTHFATWSGDNEGQIQSIAYNEGEKLLVGDANDCVVYSCLEPMAINPRFARLNNLKQPGGESKVMVDWAGDRAVAGTFGDESCFSVSDDDGYAFNDVSLIDTAIDVIDDVAVSADGKTVYMTTHDESEAGAFDTSVWVNASPWMRVFSMSNADFDVYNDAFTSFMVRLAPDDATAVYMSSKGTQNVWVSKDSGKARWKHVPCYKLTSVADFTVESTDVVYAIDTAGCSKTVNSGASWTIKEPLDGLSEGRTITLAPNGDILVGGEGDVAFSKDGGDTFTRILDTTDADTVYIVCDKDYADNNMIYIGAGNEVERGTVSRSTSWASRETDELNTSAYRVVGMAQYESVIYVMVYDGAASQLWRALDLKTSDTADLSYWGYLSSSNDYSREPNVLKMSADYKAGQPKFWFIDSGASESLDSVDDPIALEGPTPKAPKSGANVAVNPETGQAQNVAFTWERYHNKYITDCEIQIATDKNFEGIIYEQAFSGIDKDVIAEVIGPTGSTTTTTADVTSIGERVELVWVDADADGIVDAGEYVEMTVDYEEVIEDGRTVTTYRMVNFMPGQTYYWRVRVSGTTYGPLISPYSDGGSFTVEPIVKFDLMAPADAAENVELQPVFIWSEYPGAIGYEIMLCEDPTFTILEWSHSVENTFYKAEEALAYNTTYYWRVRGVTGAAAPKKAAPGGPWVTGVFTTKAKPVEAAPPIVIEPTPPTQVQVIEVPVQGPPQAIPDYLLWTIIGIGGVLIIALIVLIVRTRRVA